MEIRFPDNSYSGGSARFTKMEHDLRPFFNPGHSLPRIPLGINRMGGNTGALWDTTLLQGHSLVYAPNGTGKTSAIAINALLTYPGSIATCDVKPELVPICAERRAAMGQTVIVLDPTNEVARRYGRSPVRPRRFNPLTFINPKSRSYAEDVAAIEEGMIIPHPGENPHWPVSARGCFGGYVCLAKEVYGLAATFKHVRAFMNMEPKELRPWLDKAKRRFPNSLAAEKLAPFLGEQTDEISSIKSTARAQTKFLESRELLEGMANDDPIFNLDEFAEKPTTLFVVLPADKLSSWGRWLRMIVVLLTRAIIRNTKKPAIPTLLLIDEMGTLGPMQCIEDGYGLYRSYGIRIVGFYQSIGQTKRDYPAAFNHLVANCSVLQCLGARDPETAAFFSEVLGTTTLFESTIGYVNRVQAGQGGFGRQAIGSRPLMFPHEITQLLGADPTMQHNQQLIVFPQGAQNVMMLLNPYFRETRWRGWWRDPATLRNGFANDNEAPQQSALYRTLFRRNEGRL